MAPVKDTQPRYPPTSSTMSAATTSSDAFVALTLGRSANAIDLLVPSAPPVQAAPDLKARCFDFLADLLVEHSLLFSSAELIAAFSHIPSSSYNATLEASGCCRSIRSAFFLVDNLVAIGFRDHTGAPISSSITADASTRPTGISYFAFRSTVDPSIIDTRLSLAPFSFEFWLALPQTVFVSSSPATDSAARRLSFTSPRQAPAPVATAEDLHSLDSAKFAALRHPTGADLLSDYNNECLPLFSADQLQHLVLRSATAAPAAPVLSPRMTAV